MKGENIRAIRMKRGLTQTELAKRIGCSRGYINSIEKNKKKPGTKMLERIANELKCSVKSFF